jgi:glyoxylase-like metal-dependent hydrolase (beta-lactamase superfamily II)
MELAPHLHRLGTSSLVNSYLVEDATGVTVIDAGIPGLWRDLLAELMAMRRSLGDVRALLLTHGDTDHVGFAERLRRETGVPVYVGAADAAEARGEAPKPPAERDPMRIGPLLGFLWFGLTHGGVGRTRISQVTPLEGRVTLDLPGAPVAIPLPGHTPGSFAYHVPAVDALFMGDGMTTRSVMSGAVGPAIAPFTVDRATALASLAALDGITARWVLPGHGDPWSGGLAEALRLIRERAGRPAQASGPPS